MYRFWHGLGTIILLSLASCSPGGEPPKMIPDRMYLLQPGQEVVLDVSAGLVEVRGVEGETLSIRGTRADANPVEIQAGGEGTRRLELEIQGRRAPRGTAPAEWMRAVIEVPHGTVLTVNTVEAGVLVSDLEGTIRVDSTAGDVVGERLRGAIILRSGRGNVTARDSSGEVRVLGEHGALLIEHSRGAIGSATIMGSITYRGTPAAGDRIRLEVDHGPVQVDLLGEPDLALEVQSTTGVVVCPPALPATSRGCGGAYGAGGGSLTVRTVSGKITVRHIP
jgi:hypothetical protein